MRRIPAPALLLLLVVSKSAAQTPLQAAKDFLQAHTDQQWSTMASFVDSASLRALRATADRMAAMLAVASSPAARAAADSMRAPELARAMEGIQSMFGGASMLQLMFARVPDTVALKALSDRELMARWFEAKSIGYVSEIASASMSQRMSERAGRSVQRAYDRLGALRLPWEVIGSAVEGDSIAHVVYRLAGRNPPAATGVLTFRSTNGRWLIRFTNPDDQLAALNALVLRAVQDTPPRR